MSLSEIDEQFETLEKIQKNDTEESLFNSKLFLDFDSEEEEVEIKEEKEENERIKNLLSHELIEELDSSTSCPSSPELSKKCLKINDNINGNSNEGVSLERKYSNNNSKQEENSSDETTSVATNEDENKENINSINYQDNKFTKTTSTCKNKFGQFYYFYPCFMATTFVPINNQNNTNNSNDTDSNENNNSNNNTNATSNTNYVYSPMIAFVGSNCEYYPKCIIPSFKRSILKPKRKAFVAREGDWKCAKCQNQNFAFRKKCNKCFITKEESIELDKANKEENEQKEEIKS